MQPATCIVQCKQTSYSIIYNTASCCLTADICMYMCIFHSSVSHYGPSGMWCMHGRTPLLPIYLSAQLSTTNHKVRGSFEHTYFPPSHSPTPFRSRCSFEELQVIYHPSVRNPPPPHRSETPSLTLTARRKSSIVRA